MGFLFCGKAKLRHANMMTVTALAHAGASWSGGAAIRHWRVKGAKNPAAFWLPLILMVY